MIVERSVQKQYCISLPGFVFPLICYLSLTDYKIIYALFISEEKNHPSY